MLMEISLECPNCGSTEFDDWDGNRCCCGSESYLTHCSYCITPLCVDFGLQEEDARVWVAVREFKPSFGQDEDPEFLAHHIEKLELDLEVRQQQLMDAEYIQILNSLQW